MAALAGFAGPDGRGRHRRWGISPRPENMRDALTQGYATATDLADYLAKKGLPFRKAHKVVGEAVAYGIKHRKYLVELTLDEYKQFSPLFEKDLLEALRPENCVAARTSYGGPAPKENAKQLTLGRSLVDGQKKTLHELVTKRCGLDRKSVV